MIAVEANEVTQRSSLAAGFDLSAIASIGSAISLIVFGLVTVAHFGEYRETGARPWVLGIALASIVIVLTAFTFSTLIHEP